MSIYKNGNKVMGSITAIDDNHIKEVANADRNIKTYTTLEQLGLTAPVTTGEIFNVMPDNSIARIPSTINTDTIISDVPYPYGILLIDKSYSDRFDIEFKKSHGSSNLGDTKWIGQLKGSDGSGLTWDKVCTTTIEDVSTTSVATQNLGEGYVSYNIINGICTIALNSIKVTSNALQYITTEAINLPAQAINNSWYQIFSTSGDVGFVRVVDGKIQTFNNFDATKNYHGTFSYKVAES